MPATNGWDWEIVSYDGSMLVLGAGVSVSYGHSLLLEFVDVSYLALPSQFSNPTFREPSTDEVRLVRRSIGELPLLLAAFDVDAHFGGGTVSCLVAADAHRVRTGAFPRGHEARSRASRNIPGMI